MEVARAFDANRTTNAGDLGDERNRRYPRILAGMDAIMERIPRAWMLAAGAGVAGALWIGVAQGPRPNLPKRILPKFPVDLDDRAAARTIARQQPRWIPDDAIQGGETPMEEFVAAAPHPSQAPPSETPSLDEERPSLTAARLAPSPSPSEEEELADNEGPALESPTRVVERRVDEPAMLFEEESEPASAPEIEFSGPRLASIEAEALENIRRGLRLGDRRAYFAARSHFVTALGSLTRAFDAQARISANDPESFGGSLAAALTALDEMDDFSPRDDALDAEIDLVAVVESHRTPVLKGRGAVNGIEAARAYLDYAVVRFARAGGRSHVASQALYGLGRAHMALRHDIEQNARVHAAKAMACQQAALRIDPENHLASNELGVLYAEFRQYELAKSMLLKSVASSSQPTAWQNLAAVHDLLGEKRLAQLARRERDLAARSAGQSPADAAIEDRLVWVPPEKFGGAISQAPQTARGNGGATRR